MRNSWLTVCLTLAIWEFGAFGQDQRFLKKPTADESTAYVEGLISRNANALPALAAIHILSNPDIVVPKLTSALLRLDVVEEAQVDRLLALIVYAADENAVRGVVALRDVLPADRIDSLINRILDHALNRERAFGVARYAAGIPASRAPVASWLGDLFQHPNADLLMAQSSAKIRGGDDLLLDLLGSAERLSVSALIERIRKERDR